MNLGQARKFAVALVSLVAAAVTLFVTVDPSLNVALVTLVGAAFGAAGVFLAKNSTPDDLSKAVAQLQGAALSVAGLFVTVPTTLAEKISVVVAAALSVYLVYRFPNDSPTSS